MGLVVRAVSRRGASAGVLLPQAPGRDFEILGIDTQETGEGGIGSVAEIKLGYPQLHDGDGDYAKEDLKTTGVPENFLVDPEGDLALLQPGPVTDGMARRTGGPMIETDARRALALLLLATARPPRWLAAALPPAAAPRSPRPPPRHRGRGDVPVCGVDLELASESPQAIREREFIRGLIAEGQTKEQIKDALVAEFGDEVLALPDDEGFDLAAWLVPGAAIVVAAVAIFVGLRRWRRGRRSRRRFPRSHEPGLDRRSQSAWTPIWRATSCSHRSRVNSLFAPFVAGVCGRCAFPR